jgi:hypothetical protein
MDDDVRELAADSGPLMQVRGIAVGGQRFRALDLEFAAGTLCLRCDDDTDEVLASVSAQPSEYDRIDDGVLGVVGLSIEYAWILRNHRCNTDAFQLRLVDGRGREETRQFEVAASALDVLRVLS